MVRGMKWELPQTTATRALLVHKLSESLGWGVMGVFFPIIMGRAYGLDAVGTLWLVFALYVGYTLTMPWLVWGLTRLRDYRVGLGVGMGLSTLMLVLLSQESWLESRWVLGVSFVAQFMTWGAYWPLYLYSFEFIAPTAERGRYQAILQIFAVGGNLLGPVLTGWLLARNLDGYALGVGAGFMAVATVAIAWLPRLELPLFQLGRHWQYSLWMMWRAPYRWGVLVSGIYGVVFYVVFPLLTVWALGGDFVVMGAVVALSALVETGVSLWAGKLSDRLGARRVLRRYGWWLRGLDFAGRALIGLLPYGWYVGAAYVLAGVLGPAFNVSFSARIHDLGEEVVGEEKLYFYTAGEAVAGLLGLLTVGVAAGILQVWGWGVLTMWLLGLSGLAVGFRRF